MSQQVESQAVESNHLSWNPYCATYGSEPCKVKTLFSLVRHIKYSELFTKWCFVVTAVNDLFVIYQLIPSASPIRRERPVFYGHSSSSLLLDVDLLRNTCMDCSSHCISVKLAYGKGGQVFTERAVSMFCTSSSDWGVHTPSQGQTFNTVHQQEERALVTRPFQVETLWNLKAHIVCF